jgi:hypothetical protein
MIFLDERANVASKWNTARIRSEYIYCKDFRNLLLLQSSPEAMLVGSATRVNSQKTGTTRIYSNDHVSRSANVIYLHNHHGIHHRNIIRAPRYACTGKM